MNRLIATLFACLVSTYANAAVTKQFEIYGAHTKEDLETLKSWGFTQLIIDNSDLLEEADRMGFGIVQPNWFTVGTPWEKVKASIDQAARLKNLISVNLIDEPMYYGSDERPPELYARLRKKIKAIYPQMPLSYNEYGPRPEWGSSTLEFFRSYINNVDKVRIDSYHVFRSRPLSTVYDWHMQVKSLMGYRVIPIVDVLETWTEDPYFPKLPSIAQLRVMAYEVLLLEAETLSFFDYNPVIWAKVPGFTKGFANLIKELTSFSSQFKFCSVSTIMDTNKILTSQLTCPNSQFYQVDVNTNREAVNGLAGYQIKIVEL